MRPLRWLWHKHELVLDAPGWVIVLAVIWGIDGTIHLLIDAAVALTHLL